MDERSIYAQLFLFCTCFPNSQHHLSFAMAAWRRQSFPALKEDSQTDAGSGLFLLCTAADHFKDHGFDRKHRTA
jgi:hypothetical protein